jgi:hypothetical protein
MPVAPTIVTPTTGSEDTDGVVAHISNQSDSEMHDASLPESSSTLHVTPDISAKIIGQYFFSGSDPQSWSSKISSLGFTKIVFMWRLSV